MRWIRHWLIGFGVMVGILFIVAIHFYFVLAIATAIHDFDHFTEFSKYQWEFLIGAVLIAVVFATCFAISMRKS